MRSLERNKVPIYYALYGVKIPQLDAYGNDTGEFTIGYTNPLKFKIRVSANKGEASTNAFGLSIDYDRVMNTTDKNFPITETSVLWIGVVPVLKEDGSTDTKHDYIVKKCAPDINEFSFAIKKVTS